MHRREHILPARAAASLVGALVSLLLALGGCGQWRMNTTDRAMHRHMAAGRYDAALNTLRAARNRAYKARDRVVYWMNEGTLLHLAGDYRASIVALERAEVRSDDLYTRSLSKEMSALVTSPAATDYAGEDHEKVLLNVIKALDFLALDDKEGALVEARRINRKLARWSRQRGDAGGPGEDAFAHWLAGLLYEAEGSHDDARIALHRAYELYAGEYGRRHGVTAPSWAAEDVARAALASGDSELLERYRTAAGDPGLGRSWETLRDRGEVIVVHLRGTGPRKSDFFVNCWFRSRLDWHCDHRPGGEAVALSSDQRRGNQVRVAFPRLELTAPRGAPLTAAVAGEKSTAEAMMPINAIARRALASRRARVFAHTVVRAIVKAESRTATKALSKKAGSSDKTARAMSWLAGTAMNLAEEADKRTWSTLPAQIDVARLSLPPGTHALVLAAGGTETTYTVHVEAGERVFVTHRTMQ